MGIPIWHPLPFYDSGVPYMTDDEKNLILVNPGGVAKLSTYSTGVIAKFWG